LAVTVLLNAIYNRYIDTLIPILPSFLAYNLVQMAVGGDRIGLLLTQNLSVARGACTPCVCTFCISVVYRFGYVKVKFFCKQFSNKSVNGRF
jgi:hypothetical protein